MEIYFDILITDICPKYYDLHNLHPRIDHITQEWKYIQGQLGYGEDATPLGAEEIVEIETTHVEFRKGSIIYLSRYNFMHIHGNNGYYRLLS